MKRIADIINKDVIIIEKGKSFQDALKIMRENDIGKLPVVENNEIIGVVTRDDLLVKQGSAPTPPVIAFWDLLITLPQNKEFSDKLHKLAGYNVEEIMSDEFLKVMITDDLEKTVSDILEDKKGFALVYDGKKFEGIITKSDLIRKAF